MEKMPLRWEILHKTQKLLWSQLEFLRDTGFYLAGGTALALQIGHRESIDYDFFTPRDFDALALFEKFQALGHEVNVVQQAKNTLYLNVGGVSVSMFKYIYPLVGRIYNDKHVDLASILDIGAMKIQAIIQRGTRRDFIDFYFLLKTMPLTEILKAHEAKYGKAHNTYLALQALVYFEDAEKETTKQQRKMLLPFDWIKAKQFLRQEVFGYQKQYL